MAKPRLALIDHSYKKKTASSSFLEEILEGSFEIDRFWDDSWQKGDTVDLADIKRRDYDAVVFFQMIDYPVSLVRNVARSVTLVPMLDMHGGRSPASWTRYRDVKFLNFSVEMHRRISGAGLDSLYMKYFPDPSDFEPTTDFSELRAFYWQRMASLDWDVVKRLAPAKAFASFHVHCAPDPGGSPREISPEDLRAYGISISRWFPSRKDFLEKTRSANIFFAPRLREGIGLSFLEAMAQGKCVVAADRATMNEYIVNGRNGLLFDPRTPDFLDFSHAQELGKSARESIQDGHRKWLEQVPNMIEYIRLPNKAASRVRRGRLAVYRSVAQGEVALSGLKRVIRKNLPGFYALVKGHLKR